MGAQGSEGLEDPRWQYKVLWRYGALLLVVVGLLAIAFGAADVTGQSTSVTLLSIGFASLVAGVVLPRIEGKFTAGPSGVSAEVLAVHHLDPQFAITGPALAQDSDDGGAGAEADQKPQGPRVTIGDVWDALEAAGVRSDAAAMGHAYFVLRGDHTLEMPNRGFIDWGFASDDLLAVLDTWGIHPTASGKYPPRVDVLPQYLERRLGSLQNLPRNQ